MDPVFQTAFLLHTPPRVLGRQLLPFSLGHSLTLESINSPVLGSGPVQPGDLAIAVWVCSRRATELVRKFDPAAISAEFARWGRRTPPVVCETDLVLFRAYLAAFIAAPARWDAEGPRREMKAPWQYTIAAALRQHLKCTFDEAWNTPVNRALADYAVLGEALGDESLMTDQERAEVEAINHKPSNLAEPDHG